VKLLATGVEKAPAIPGAVNVTTNFGSDAEVERLAEFQPDIVLHLGGLSSVASGASNASAMMYSNLTGSVRLARVLRQQHQVAFVFASSGEVYGESFLDGEVTETTAVRPKNAYARSKAAIELALTDMLADRGPLILVRAFNHSGAGQDERFVLPSFAAQIARIEAGLSAPPILVGNLAAERDFLHVDDMVSAYLRVLGRISERPSGASVYNVCSSSSRSIKSMLDELISMARKPITVEIDPNRMRASDVPRAKASSALFRQSHDWRPERSVTEMLAELLCYWRSNVT
jgi:GDP-4-dehydro-6-deoxy-D-mannose reductase